MTVWRAVSLPPMDAAPQAGEGESHVRALALFVAALTLMRLTGLMLSNTELFFDEAQYWFWSRDLAFGYYSKPPLIAWIIRASTSVCGMSEACIRAPSPVIHAATAMLVYAIGHTLYGARVGFWAGLVYATLPGVSFSSTLISTDVPLLFFVALALTAIVKMRDGPSWRWAVTLGVAIGCGLLAKYAMSYMLLGLALYGAFTSEGRALFRSPHVYAALGIAAAILAPNLIWNAGNGFATLAHTADNAGWGGGLLHPAAAAQFLLGQLGVFGPLQFPLLIILLVRADKGSPERMLLLFSLPVLLLMTAQAFISRAHANWAAFAYVGGAVFVTATMMRAQWSRLFRISLGLHVGIAVIIAVAGVFAGRAVLPVIGDPFARVQGWKHVADAAANKAEAGGFHTIATDRRSLAAEFAYYLRDRNISIVALRRGAPRDHFELTRPLKDDTPRPILLVSLGGLSAADDCADTEGDACNGDVLRGAEPAGTLEFVQGKKRRTINFYAIKGSVP